MVIMFKEAAFSFQFRFNALVVNQGPRRQAAIGVSRRPCPALWSEGHTAVHGVASPSGN